MKSNFRDLLYKIYYYVKSARPMYMFKSCCQNHGMCKLKTHKMQLQAKSLILEVKPDMHVVFYYFL